MHTPGHALINLAVLGAPLHHPYAILLGAVLPDLPILILYVRERLRGTPEETIWAVSYQQAHWLAIIHGVHSIPITATMTVASLLCGQQALLCFFASALLHALCDLPVHAVDAHRHFLPFSHYRFHSPFSYWDPRYHARYVALIEALLVLGSSLAIWRRGVGLAGGGLLVLVNAGYGVGYYRSFLRPSPRPDAAA